ncbi:MAG: SAM-dependent methyltransferase [Bacteroidales bacterium]|jgi:methyltransferase (TIGR00027 family)|nr:SAM-dependent methyltransferase [Bacteroidales bacterium]
MSKRKRIDKKSSRTAGYTCMCRASSYLESNIYYRSDDYIAVKLLPHLIKILLKFKIINLKGRISPTGIYPYVIARTKYIDTIFEDSIKKGFEQTVIMGAGFDSRAIRFYSSGRSNIRVYEIDTNHTQNAKTRQLINRGINIPDNNIYIPVDFNKENIRSRLDENKFKSSKKTLFILEGFIMYLSHDAIDETFKIIYDYSAPGSLIVFDYVYASVLRKELKYYGEGAIYQRVTKDNEKWTFGIEEGGIESFLKSYNFSLLEHLDSKVIEKKYFTNESGNLITKVNGTHCIVLAKRDD